MTVGKFKFVLWYKSDAATAFSDLKVMCLKYDWTYYAAGDEVCPNTGRVHLDGYYEYSTQRRLETEIKKWNKTFGKGFGKLFLANGSHGENFDYSSKENRRVDVYGSPSLGQGNRTDLLALRDDITAGILTAEQVALENPSVYHQYGRTLHKIEDIRLRSQFRTWMTKGFWYWGPTHSGKSHIAFEGYDSSTHYLWKDDKGWQDGYIGQEIVIINDFRGSIAYNELLTLIDKWPTFIPRRGREPAPFLAKKVIITSSLPPHRVYKNRDIEDSLEQLLRRFEIIECSALVLPEHFEAS